MIDVLKALCIIATAILAVRTGLLTLRLWSGDDNFYNQNRRRTRSLKNAVFGLVPTDYDGRRDYRVAAGIAFNKKTDEWIEQGRLSSEAIQSTLRH